MCRLACLQARRPLRWVPPCSRSPWGLPGCMARPRPARLGGWPWRMAATAPSDLSDHFSRLQPDQADTWGIGCSGRPTPSSPSPRPTASGAGRAVQSHAEGTDHHPWSHLPQHRGAAGRRPRLRRTLQCPVDRRKERLPEPRSSSSGVARRDLNQARRVRQTCVQGTGCATAVLIRSWRLSPLGRRCFTGYRRLTLLDRGRAPAILLSSTNLLRPESIWFCQVLCCRRKY